MILATSALRLQKNRTQSISDKIITSKTEIGCNALYHISYHFQ